MSRDYLLDSSWFGPRLGASICPVLAFSGVLFGGRRLAVAADEAGYWFAKFSALFAEAFQFMERLIDFVVQRC